MKIAVVIYSYTGNTFSVGKKIVDFLQNHHHQVQLIRVSVIDDQPSKTDIELGVTESVEPYDKVIFGSPVRAFSLAPAMIKYLQQIESIHGKPVSCFVTKQLPFVWTGGSGALNKMIAILNEKGAVIGKKAVINWASKDRENQISEFVRSLV